MSRYYFLICSLPPLVLGNKPEISYEDLSALLEINLSDDDRERVAKLKNYTDFKNLRSFWLKKNVDDRGNLSEKDLEEALLVQDFFPQYVFDFLKAYESVEYRIAHFSYLLMRFLKEQSEQETLFLKEYFNFEREVLLILTALRAKQLRRDIALELRHEDQTDFLVSYIMAQRDMDSFSPPKEYDVLKDLFIENVAEPRKMHWALLNYRLKKIEELKINYPFTIDWLLGYLAELMLVEDWWVLDQKQGLALIERLYG
jgi:hypothetical protein